MRAFGKCNGGGWRKATRQKAPLMAVLTKLTHSDSAIVIDISRTGLRLRGEMALTLGSEYLIAVESVRTFGTVRWIDGASFGIAFDEPLSIQDIQWLRHRAAKGGGLSPELLAAMDDWTLGLAR